MSTNPKRVLKSLSVCDKIRLIGEVDRGIKRKKEIAADFGIPANTLSTIYKKRDVILDKYGSFDIIGDRKRFKTSLYVDVEEAVLNWLQSCHENKLLVTRAIIKEKAQDFAKILGHPEFVASSGWLHKFKNRHSIVQKLICKQRVSNLIHKIIILI